MTKTLKSEIGAALKERIEKYKTQHQTETRIMTDVVMVLDQRKCLHCKKLIPTDSYYFYCSEYDPASGSGHEMWFCNQQHHDECIDSGYPFGYKVAIEIARSLGAEAGVISFTEWLVASVEGNAEIDLSPYFKRGDLTVELGEDFGSLESWQKNYLEEAFEYCREEMYQRLYTNIVPSR